MLLSRAFPIAFGIFILISILFMGTLIYRSLGHKRPGPVISVGDRAAQEHGAHDPEAEDSLVRSLDEVPDREKAEARAKARRIRSFDETVPWLRNLAEQGDRDSQFILGRMYFEGEAVPQDWLESYKWLGLAAKRGESDAQKLIGTVREKLSTDQQGEAEKWVSEFTVQPLLKGKSRPVNPAAAPKAIP